MQNGMPDHSAEYARQFCRNCGEEIVGDDQGGWLHERTASRRCDLNYFAEPRDTPNA